MDGIDSNYLIATVNDLLIVIKRVLSLLGSLIILSGAFIAIYRFLIKARRSSLHQTGNYDMVRLDLGRSIILGLEFIIASDVIETTTMPDYYSLGILAALVLIRTFLTYTLNKDLTAIYARERINE